MGLDPIVVATDGSCLGNPGPGGWAWVASPDCWAAGGHPRTTNNLMELRAVFELLNILPRSQPLVIETDSEYVINIFTEWLAGWKERGWRTSGRKPVSNQSAILEVDRMLQDREVQWQHVRGHSGHALNELADLRARTNAEAVKVRRQVDAGNPGCLNRLIHPTSTGAR